MRVNLNSQTSVINSWNGGELRWFDHLQAEFCRDHDLDTDSDHVISYLWQPDAARDMAAWLRAKGHRANYYELSYKYNKAGVDRPICYGIEFDDSCPLFTELRLKQGG